MARHRIAVLAPADVTPFGLGVAVEAFGTPRPREDLGYDVEVCTAHPGEASVTNALFGVRILHGLEAIDRADTLVVLQVDLSTLPVEPEVIAAVRRAHRRGARLVSFCTGAFVLAAAGVLDGRRATTHWYFARRLARAHPLIQVDPDVLYVDGGRCSPPPAPRRRSTSACTSSARTMAPMSPGRSLARWWSPRTGTAVRPSS